MSTPRPSRHDAGSVAGRRGTRPAGPPSLYPERAGVLKRIPRGASGTNRHPERTGVPNEIGIPKRIGVPNEPVSGSLPKQGERPHDRRPLEKHRPPLPPPPLHCRAGCPPRPGRLAAPGPGVHCGRDRRGQPGSRRSLDPRTLDAVPGNLRRRHLARRIAGGVCGAGAAHGGGEVRIPQPHLGGRLGRASQRAVHAGGIIRLQPRLLAGRGVAGLHDRAVRQQPDLGVTAGGRRGPPGHRRQGRRGAVSLVSRWRRIRLRHAGSPDRGRREGRQGEARRDSGRPGLQVRAHLHGPLRPERNRDRRGDPRDRRRLPRYRLRLGARRRAHRLRPPGRPAHQHGAAFRRHRGRRRRWRRGYAARGRPRGRVLAALVAGRIADRLRVYGHATGAHRVGGSACGGPGDGSVADARRHPEPKRLHRGMVGGFGCGFAQRIHRDHAAGHLGAGRRRTDRSPDPWRRRCGVGRLRRRARPWPSPWNPPTSPPRST